MDKQRTTNAPKEPLGEHTNNIVSVDKQNPKKIH
jgi:hypothetical protein